MEDMTPYCEQFHLLLYYEYFRVYSAFSSPCCVRCAVHVLPKIILTTKYSCPLQPNFLSSLISPLQYSFKENIIILLYIDKGDCFYNNRQSIIVLSAIPKNILIFPLTDAIPKDNCS